MSLDYSIIGGLNVRYLAGHLLQIVVIRHRNLSVYECIKDKTHSYIICSPITTHWHILMQISHPSHIFDSSKNRRNPAARQYIQVYRNITQWSGSIKSHFISNEWRFKTVSICQETISQCVRKFVEALINWSMCKSCN